MTEKTDDDITVEVEGEKPIEVSVDKPNEPELPLGTAAAKPADGPVAVEIPAEPTEDKDEAAKGPDPVAELQAQLERMRESSARMQENALAERRAREAAEQEARAAREESGNKNIEIADTRLHAITNAIAAEKGEAEALKAALRQATADGDMDKVADINMKFGEIGSRLRELNDGKAQLEAYLRAPRKPAAAQRPTVQPPRPTEQTAPAASQTTGDPAEDYIRSMPPRVQDYLRGRDKTWLTDKRTNDKLVAAHFTALSEGYAEESPGYFARIDDQMGVKTEAPGVSPGTVPAARRAAPARAKPAIPAAPTSPKAATSGQTEGGQRTVTLTAREQEAAKSQGLTNQEYGRRKWIMSQPGWTGPRFGQGH